MASTRTSTASFNYIVVGGGTSGCVVASRLSEDRDVRVLLLEAGSTSSEASDLIRVPANLGKTQKTKYDWNYKTVPQKQACKAFRDNVCVWPRGKVLGGSSCINGLKYVRGHREDFDSWERLGCTGWGWDQVLPYFKKLENFISSESDPDHPGKVTISNNLFGKAGSSDYFAKAGAELGYDLIDINDDNGEIIGFGDFPSTVSGNGDRCSADVAYIQHVKHRENIRIITNARVTKIDIKDNRAVGVHVRINGENEYFAAKDEVILSGGATNSPQILMLSGIGPKKHLEEVGIPCVADLPVGKNLQDHMNIQLKADVKPGSDVFTMNRDHDHRTNPCEVAGFVKTKHETRRWPDLELQPLPMIYSYGTLGPMLYPVKPEFYKYHGFEKTITEFRNREGFTYQLVLLHPYSRGEVKLANNDPCSNPIIDPNYLEDERDVDVLVEAIRLSKRITESAAMAPLEMHQVGLRMPNSSYPPYSEENLREYVRHFAWTVYHPVGTCKMGSKTDKTAVVDPELRVNGIKGLRVIDASIMPHLTSGNTMAPCFMIGEKGADFIRRESSKREASKL